MLLLVAGVASALSITAGFRALGSSEEDAPVLDAKAGSPASSSSEAGGAVTIAIGERGTSANRLSISAHDLAPGDRSQRTVDLMVGPVPPADVLLSTVATTSSILDVDLVNGLQLTIDRCPEPWVMQGPDNTPTFTCSSTPETVVRSGSVIQDTRGIGAHLQLADGATNYLRTELYLPEEADNDHSGQLSVIRFEFETVPYA